MIDEKEPLVLEEKVEDTISWPPNAHAVRRDLINDSKRLFSGSGQNIEIEVATVDAEGRCNAELLRSETEVSEYFQTFTHHAKREAENACRSAIASSKARFFCINPNFGWGHLPVSIGCMNHMLGSLKVFPQFARYLQSFGIKDFAQDEGFSGFDFKAKWDSHGDLGVVESCYHLKYAEMHGDAGTFYNPWSVRQAAIYQRFDIKTGSNDCILIRLSDCMRDDLGEFLRRPDQPRPFKMDWDCIHLLAVASLTAGWRKYINYLDREVSKMFDTVIVSQVDPKKVEEKGLAETALNYMKRLQYLMDQIARTQHMLALNIKVMQMMRVRSTQIPELLAHERKEVDASNLDIVLESNIADHEFASLNAGSLWARASILSNQLRDTISFQNGESMKAITRSTNEGNQALFGLSAKAMIETRTMKVLAILGTIFVPASFVADLLQTGYINVLQTSGFAVSATKGLWLYFSIAAPLIMATMMVFLYSEVLNRRRLAKTLAMEQSEFA